MKEDSSLGFLRGKRSRAIFEPRAYKDRQLVLIKSIFDSNDCISKQTQHPYIIQNILTYNIGFNTIDNLYAFTSPTDIIADNYDKDQYIILNSCFIKCSVKDKARSNVESIKEYCDVNVSAHSRKKKKTYTNYRKYFPMD